MDLTPGVVPVTTCGHCAAPRVCCQMKGVAMPEERDGDLLAAAQFWAAISAAVFDAAGGDVEYDTFLDVAGRYGLLDVVTYDPEKHGAGFGDPEPGDTIYWPTERATRLRALVPTEKSDAD